MLHTPTSQPLFIRHKSAAELLEKQAAAVARMPDDDKRWPAQVLSEMHKQLPFLSKFDVDIELTRVEPEAGYALGYAMLRNKTGKQRAAEELGKPTNKIRVPVIVADRLLQPFHVFEVGGKTYPLTQERVESAMMNPSMFDGISDPPGTQSLLDQIYPPFQHRQGYGMMSGDRATVGLSKLSSAPRVTNTASGESGPLREFLRQQEIAKLANIVTTEAKAVAGPLSKFLSKRPPAFVRPQGMGPVRTAPGTAATRTTTTAARRVPAAETTQALPRTVPTAAPPVSMGGGLPVRAGPGVGPAGSRPVSTSGEATQSLRFDETPTRMPDLPRTHPNRLENWPSVHDAAPAPATSGLKEKTQAIVAQDAPPAAGGGPLEIRTRQPDMLDQLTARRRAAAGTTAPAPAVSTPVARDPAQVLADRRAVVQRVEAANAGSAPGAAQSAPPTSPPAAAPAGMSREEMLAHDFHMTSQGMRGVSPEQYKQYEAAAAEASNRTGKQVSAADIHAHLNPARPAAAPKAPSQAETLAHDSLVQHHKLHPHTSPADLKDLQEAQKIIKKETGKDVSLGQIQRREVAGAPDVRAAEPATHDPMGAHDSRAREYYNLQPEAVRGIAAEAGISNDWLAAYAKQQNATPGQALHLLEGQFLQAQSVNPNLKFPDFMAAQQARGGLFGNKYSPTGAAGGGFLGSAAGGATMLGLGALGGGMMMANKASENY